MNYTLITGASTGIGKAFAQELALKGDNLILTARSFDKLQVIASDLRGVHAIDVICIASDLSVEDAPLKLFNLCKEYDVTTLINNAGFGLNGSFLDNDFQTESSLVQVNIMAVMQLTHLFGQKMKEKQSGSILNVSSTASFQAGPFMANYYASKAYVTFLSEALHEELKSFNIKVSAFCPGATRSEFFSQTRGMKLPTFVMEAEDVVRIALKGLAKNQTIITAGLMNKIMVLMGRFSPRIITVKFAGIINKKIIGK